MELRECALLIINLWQAVLEDGEGRPGVQCALAMRLKGASLKRVRVAPNLSGKYCYDCNLNGFVDISSACHPRSAVQGLRQRSSKHLLPENLKQVM